MNSLNKYSVLFSLYIAQSVPMSFFSTVLPVIMRMEKFSMTSIALIQLIKIPWVLKFLWAPLVDRNSLTNSHYRRWIVASELFYAASIIAIAFFNLATDFTTIIILMVLAIIFSATQDIASDAFAVRILKKQERPFGNSIQSMGNFGGTLIGSGFLLILYTITGWQWLMVLLAAFVLIALLPLILSKIDDEKPILPPIVTRVKFIDIFRFFRIKGTGRWVLVLATYYSGILGILALLKPWMVDLGYSVKEIAFMVGIYGTGCGAAGAFLAGFIIKFLGQRKSMILFSCYSFLAASLFLYLNYATISKADLYAAIAILWTAYSMSSVLIYTVSMGKTRKGKEGTDYSIQIVISHLQGILIAMLAGKTYDLFGPKTPMLAETTMAALVVIIVIFSPKVVAETRELSTIQPDPHENAR